MTFPAHFLLISAVGNVEFPQPSLHMVIDDISCTCSRAILQWEMLTFLGQHAHGDR